jgi:hypothetical protein
MVRLSPVAAELLAPVARWTPGRKAAVILGLRRHEVTIDQVTQAHDLSLDELVTWNDRHRKHGQHGLAITKLQVLT